MKEMTNRENKLAEILNLLIKQFKDLNHFNSMQSVEDQQKQLTCYVMAINDIEELYSKEPVAIEDFPNTLISVQESDFGPLLTAVSMINEKYHLKPAVTLELKRKNPANNEKGQSEPHNVCQVNYRSANALFSLGQLHGVVITKTKS